MRPDEGIAFQSGSSFHGNAAPLHLLVLTQFRPENRRALFL
jgi:hypothetical protein